MSALETRLRETLVREANRGDPWPVVTPALLRRARRQRVRTALAAASTMLALVCVGTWSACGPRLRATRCHRRTIRSRRRWPVQR